LHLHCFVIYFVTVFVSSICQTVCFIRFCSVHRDFYAVIFPCLPCITPVVYIEDEKIISVSHSKGNKIHNVINCAIFDLQYTIYCYNLIYGTSYTRNTVIFDMLPLIHKRRQRSKRWRSCSFQALPGKQTDSPRNSENLIYTFISTCIS
jgi:hypothetical protein